METKFNFNSQICTPYFEDGVFKGVRVSIDDEDFVIAPEDYNNGEELTWNYAMYFLNDTNLETFNHKQACFIAAYHKEINEILVQNGGHAFEQDTHYWTNEELSYHSAYDYFEPGTIGISVKALKVRVRLITDLRPAGN